MKLRRCMCAAALLHAFLESHQMSWTNLPFSQHSGKSLPQVLFSDPDWFFWASAQGVFRRYPAIAKEGDLLLSRATRIIPPTTPTVRDPVVQYVVDGPTRKFLYFTIIERARPSELGVVRSELIDMSMPRQLSPYDKAGGRTFLACLKFYMFGDKSARMTRTRAEAFFDDEAHFA